MKRVNRRQNYNRNVVRAAYPALMGGVGYAVAKQAYRAYKHYKNRKSVKDKGSTIDNNGDKKRVRMARRPRVMSNTRKPTVKALAKRVKNMQCLLNASCGEMIFRQMATGALTSSVKQQNSVSVTTFHTSYYESVLAQLRYYDPNTPGTLVTADGAAGTYSKDFCFTDNYAKLTVRNNYQTPCEVSVYYMVCKTDTSIDPNTAWSNGVADTSNSAITSPLIYPTDSDQIDRLWSIKKTVKKQLEPGASVVCTHSVPKFDYDPAVADSQTETFRKEHHGFAFLLVVKGILGHDSGGAAQYGIIQSGVDWRLDRVSKVRYDAGANIKYIYITDGSAASFTTSGVVSSKPVSDNLTYSVA